MIALHKDANHFRKKAPFMSNLELGRTTKSLSVHGDPSSGLNAAARHSKFQVLSSGFEAQHGRRGGASRFSDGSAIAANGIV